MTTDETPAGRPTYGSGVVRALENAWHFLMSLHSELPDMVIVTGSGMDSVGGKWGHFRANGWNVRTETGEAKVKIDEMFMAGETLSQGGRKAMNTMTHEAAHVLAAVRGVQDTSRQHRWHNKEFLKIARELGMEYKQAAASKSIGYSGVTLTEETVAAYEAIIEELDRAIRADITLPPWLGGSDDQDGGENVHGGRKPKDPDAPKTGNQKAVCGCAEPTIIYLSKKAQAKGTIRCDDCDNLFEFA